MKITDEHREKAVLDIQNWRTKYDGKQFIEDDAIVALSEIHAKALAGRDQVMIEKYKPLVEAVDNFKNFYLTLGHMNPDVVVAVKSAKGFDDCINAMAKAIRALGEDQ